MSEGRKIKIDARYRLLRKGNIDTFSNERKNGTRHDSTGADKGTGIHDAKVSGAYFPDEYSADELTMSRLHGTE